VVIQGEELLLIQITTSNPPNESKIDNLSLEMEDISKIYLKIGNELNVRGWFVSLFEFKNKLPFYKNINTTIGNDLITILGEQLHSRLKKVKESI
ncbi:MAG: hypothetical protein ACTSUT_09805, partial [Promethearchaeota archaeon]